jgi:hypothetical protein
VGASRWSYLVPYQPDLDRALQQLRQRAFDAGDYYWAAARCWASDDDTDRAARALPASIDALFAEESTLREGTRSILDVRRVLSPDEEPTGGDVEPVTAEQALRCTGTATPTRAHRSALTELVRGRWFGRCAVLHDTTGTPSEIYFFGLSGDRPQQ